jgi:hypothetical protein
MHIHDMSETGLFREYTDNYTLFMVFFINSFDSGAAFGFFTASL